MNPYDAGSGGPAGKLIRNRSTKANDDWWRSVQDAAKTAPKLTYERSAPMANEDVIDMAAGRIARCRCRRTDEQCYDCRLFAGLAAALREAREDTRRLDWLEKNIYVASDIVPGGNIDDLDWRHAIDAAMKPPGGEESR